MTKSWVNLGFISCLKPTRTNTKDESFPHHSVLSQYFEVQIRTPKIYGDDLSGLSFANVS